MEASRSKLARSIDLIGPDLRNMPPLAEYLSRLDAALPDPLEYAYAYNAVVAEISGGDADGLGCSLFWGNNDPDDAEPRVYGGFIACDDLEEMRREYARAIHDHHPQPDQYRPELIALLLSRGHFSDNRRVDRRALFQVVGAMLKQGGRLMLNPDGGLEAAPAWPRRRDDARTEQEVQSAGRIACDYFRLAQRWRSHKALKRIVTMLGKPMNGWLVVEGAAA